MLSTSLCDFGMPLVAFSGLFSAVCERLRAFCAEPRMPSRLKLGVRADLSDVGDFNVLAPLVAAPSWGDGISTEKSRFGNGNGLTTAALVAPVMVAVAECGESPFEDGDMLNRGLRKLEDGDDKQENQASFQQPETSRTEVQSRIATSPNLHPASLTQKLLLHDKSNFSNTVNTVNTWTCCAQSYSHIGLLLRRQMPMAVFGWCVFGRCVALEPV
jgi:hypothetical protein